MSRVPFGVGVLVGAIGGSLLTLFAVHVLLGDSLSHQSAQRALVGELIEISEKYPSCITATPVACDDKAFRLLGGRALIAVRGEVVRRAPLSITMPNPMLELSKRGFLIAAIAGSSPDIPEFWAVAADGTVFRLNDWRNAVAE